MLPTTIHDAEKRSFSLRDIRLFGPPDKVSVLCLCQGYCGYVYYGCLLGVLFFFLYLGGAFA